MRLKTVDIRNRRKGGVLKIEVDLDPSQDGDRHMRGCV